MIELNLIPDSDARLHTRVEVFNPKENKEFLMDVIPRMFDLMKEKDGIGLSANQVGIMKRFFIMSIDGSDYVCINPRIIKFKNRNPIVSNEGCLSFPGKMLSLYRHDEIKVSYQNESGKRFEKKFNGITSICFQHELDHLNGITFVDRLNEKVK